MERKGGIVDAAIMDVVAESKRIFNKDIKPFLKDLATNTKKGLQELVKRVEKLERKIDNLSFQARGKAKKPAGKRPAASKTTKRSR